VTAGGQAPAGRASAGRVPAVEVPRAGPGLPAGRGTRLALTALLGSRRFGGPVAAIAVGVALVLLLQATASRPPWS